jgi:gas vesicle protein
MGKRFNVFKLGALVGGLLGIIFAPKAGKETREDIKKFKADHQQDIDKISALTKKGLDETSSFIKDIKKIGKTGFFKKPTP